MKHRIVVLGAGYAGAYCAGYLARKLHADEVEITVVNAEPDFVERLRLHQLAAGHELARRPLSEVFVGTGIVLRTARVTALDAEHRTVTVADGAGVDRIGYDTLVYTLGSAGADHGVAGVAEYAFDVAARPSALRLRARLDELDGSGKVVVVGGNLTAIEAVTEIAEARPGLEVSLVTSGEVGGWLGPKARRHVLRAFDRFGISIHEHTAVESVDETAVVAADGRVFASDATVWAAGFAVPAIAGDGGLAVQADGRITVDRQMRSVSHPDVYAAGDSVFVIGDNGRPLPMSCASAGFTGMQAVSAIVGDLTGRQVKATALSYVGNHISLGRNDAIYQLVDGAGSSKPGALCGRAAVAVKSSIVAVSGWAISRPTFGMPSRRYRLTAAGRRSPEVAVA
ncbi:NAD(P)/FAD-dependent oxidoreductase [Nocardia cyriacigeorgica]|uniref:NAD(P)/FAD-dependent oxidoreductase n=1 Tax=Nocardia cyriacigeorgica TaxID=135487 RepID=UPI0018944228|nr:FAD-dependent oxidoreductase [Nocardia cyriacigeorgica]MBF6160724.1 FAD-dependent oxidoreductase [Nocardia cyriacigeorgica]MBF6199509.1 FAD-dependent oxidoreductase [Nocardia cyriacigeorgica]